MPLYEYRCLRCHHKFEKIMSFYRSREEVKCPKCGYRAARQITAHAHVEFKGVLAE